MIKFLIKKKKITCDKLCQNLPSVVYEFIKTTRLLRFKEKPDYNKIKKIFIKYMIDENLKFDFRYDWIIKANQEK